MKKFDFAVTVTVNEKIRKNNKALTVEQAKKNAIELAKVDSEYNGNYFPNIIRLLSYIEKNDKDCEIARIAGNYKNKMIEEKVAKIEQKYRYIQAIVEQIKNLITFNLDMGEYTNILAIQNQLYPYYQQKCQDRDPYSKTVATRTRIFYALNELVEEGILKQEIVLVDGHKQPSKVWKRIK